MRLHHSYSAVHFHCGWAKKAVPTLGERTCRTLEHYHEKLMPLKEVWGSHPQYLASLKATGTFISGCTSGKTRGIKSVNGTLWNRQGVPWICTINPKIFPGSPDMLMQLLRVTRFLSYMSVRLCQIPAPSPLRWNLVGSILRPTWVFSFPRSPSSLGYVTVSWSQALSITHLELPSSSEAEKQILASIQA